MTKRNSFIESTKETDERLEALKQLYPEIFSDGKINLDAFKDVTGTSDLPEGQDRTPGYYGLYWPGKRAAKQLARKEAEGTLEPVPGDGVNEDTTHNIYIEGDNLEVLRILKQSYKGRVKMIYIDPPYNTGNDFIYPDDFKMPVEEYLKMTGQADESGKRLVTNQKSNGAFHTTWLNMMYPRLQLARELLRTDGIICISIDDNEQSNLRLLCDDVFGEENFEGHIHWRRRHNQPNDKTKMIGLVAEHILVYAKNADAYKKSGVGKLDLTAEFTNPDNDPKGPWASKPWKVGSDQSGSKYDIQAPNGKILHGEWMGEESTYKQFLAEGRIYFPKGGDGMPRKKYYQFEREEEGQCATNWWPHEQFGHNQGGNDEMTSLFGEKNLFSNPKPTKLLINLYKISNVKKDDIVMDFFSGSSSSADAVMQLHNGSKFIMVQMPFDLDIEAESGTGDSKKQAENAVRFLNSIKKSNHTICEIGKERIRRAGAKVLKEAKANKDMFSEDYQLDIGFKVYRLQNSNFLKYTPVEGQNEDSQNKLFEEFEKNQIPLVQGWKAENVLTEIILKQGFALDCTKEKVDSFKKNTIWKITDSADAVSKKIKLYVCLDNFIEEETIKNLTLNDDEKFICLDAAIDDSAYARLADKGRIETI